MLGEDGRIPYNDVGAVERALEKHGKTNGPKSLVASGSVDIEMMPIL
jgi:hypothetical protein